MRIIGGKYKKRALHPPKGLPVRPTTDFAKTGLFNILTNLNYPEGCDVLDLYTGTGNISFEFLSRDAKNVVAVDKEKKCLEFIRNTCADLQAPNLTTIRDDAISYLSKTKLDFDIIFADPPYDDENIPKLISAAVKAKCFKEDGIFILEHSKNKDYSDFPGFDSSRKYGHVAFSFFRSILALKEK